MATLQEVYASGGEIKLLETVRLYSDAWPSIYLVRDYQNRLMYVTEEDQFILHLACAMGATRPSMDNRGNQNIQVVLDNVMGEVYKRVRMAYESGSQVELHYTTYLHTDLTAPASRTLVADVKSVELSGTEARIEAGFFSLYDTNFNRITYNSKTAPALIYES